MSNISLLPVAAQPKDFKAISAKLASSAKAAGQTFSEFQAVDEISLTGSERETYRDALNKLAVTKKNAQDWSTWDNVSSGWTGIGTQRKLGENLTDLDREQGQLHILRGGAVIEASYDPASNVATRYSYLAGAAGTTTFYQQTADVIIFSEMGPQSGIGVLFDKGTGQATILSSK